MEQTPQFKNEDEKTFISLSNALEALSEVRKIEDIPSRLEAWKILRKNESFNKFWDDTIKIMLSEDDHKEMVIEFGEENV